MPRICFEAQFFWRPLARSNLRAPRSQNRVALGWKRTAILLLVAASCRIAPAQSAKPAPLAARKSFDYIGVWGKDERVYFIQKPAPHLVYISNTTAKDAGGKVPDSVEATVRLAGIYYGARFKQKNWRARILVPLTRLPAPCDAAKLDRMNPRGSPTALIVREWKGEGGGNASAFRLLPNPKNAPLFRASVVYSAKAGGNLNLGSSAPTLRIEGTRAIFDARAYDDRINAPHDVAILVNLPQGRAFGLALGARLGTKPLVIPLHKLDSARTKTPLAVVGFDGNFNPDPDLMGPVAFAFALHRK